MISLVRGGRRFPSTALAWALGIRVFTGLSAMSYGDESDGSAYKVHTHDIGQHKPSGWCMGTLGYGPPGLYPGYYGFGLSFHRGYGYGGSALGVGAEGGYPYYGGPGYPHTWPCLNRFCGITPFPYYGGSELGYANFGPVDNSGPGYPNEGGYGSFTGPAPYPESYFAPDTAAAATTGSASGAQPYDPFRGTPGGKLGFEPESIRQADGSSGLRITSLLPDTIAANAGLHTGDIIVSINGYHMEQSGNLAWVMAHAMPNNTLTMNVRKASDGKEHTVTLQLPLLEPLNTSRPAYLPLVGNGPPPATR